MIYKLPSAKNFEHNINGKNTHLITLRNRSGMQVAFTDYGARIVSILVPDNTGELRDVVLGFNSIQGYLEADEKYHGTTVGRFANRIANGSFNIDGQQFALEKNNGNNSLHGGPNGFHNQVWDRQVSFKKKVDFYYTSADGEEGFPGNLKVYVSYELTEENEIIITYKAETDRKTVVNLTNHSYFNLNGEGQDDILNHVLEIASSQYIAIDENQIPLEELANVEGTAFDFRTPKAIGKDINNMDKQLEFGNGYDHSYALDGDLQKRAAKAVSPKSGIVLEVFTSEPGVQLYTGNFLSGKDTGKTGQPYGKNTAFCLETQHYPDSPNRADFPSVLLDANEVFTSTTIYKFSIEK